MSYSMIRNAYFNYLRLDADQYVIEKRTNIENLQYKLKICTIAMSLNDKLSSLVFWRAQCLKKFKTRRLAVAAAKNLNNICTTC